MKTKRQVFTSPDRFRIQELERFPPAKVNPEFDHARYQAIEHEFRTLDTDNSGFLSRVEIAKHLLSRGCKQELIDEIFNDLNTDQDQLISRDEFTHGYLQKEVNIKEQITQHEGQIYSLRESIQQLSKEEAQECLLIVGLESGCLSKLYGHLGATDKASIQVEVQIKCKQDERCSKPSLSCEFPVWGDTFKFQMNRNTLQSDIELVLWEYKKQQKKVIGTTKITRQLGIDFQQHEQVIFDNIGEIQVNLQFYQDYIAHRDAKVEDCKYEIAQLFDSAEKLKQKLYYLQQLFGKSNAQPKIKQQWNVPQQQQVFLPLAIPELPQQLPIYTIDNNTNLSPLPTIDQQITMEVKQPQQDNILDAFNLFKITEPQSSNPIEMQLDNEFITRRYQMLCTLLLVITINVTFSRVDFIGLLTVLYAIPVRWHWNEQQTKLFTFGLLGSVVLDIYWLIVFVNCFSNADQCHNEYGIIGLIWVLVMLQSIMKIAILFYIRKYS